MHVKSRIFLFFILFLSSSYVIAGPAKFSYQGQIIKPNGQALEANSVNFKIEIISPSPTLCVLYEESHTLNMTNSNGIFSLVVGEGARPVGANYQDTSTLADALDNAIGMVTPTDCVGGPNYTASSSDGRKLRLTFDDGSGAITLAQDHNIVSVPYAANATSVDGLTAGDLIQINDDVGFNLDQTNLNFVFNDTNWAELQALLDGSSSSFSAGAAPTSDVDNNGQKIINLDDPNPASPTDAVNVRYADSNIGGQAVNSANLNALGVPENGQVLTWNGSQWESQALDDTTKLPTAGGTMTGAINMGSQNITNANNIAANNDVTVGNDLSVTNDLNVTVDATVGNDLTVSGGIGVTNGISSAGLIDLTNENQIQFREATGSGTNFVGFKAPSSVTSDVIWILPDGLGTNGQFLQTDAAGNLSWASSNGGVTSFNTRTGAVTAAASDYDADQIDFTPAGNVAANEVQAAIAEVDTEKVA